MLPRWVHRAYAAALGYSWSACPFCGRFFGGHQPRGNYTSVQVGGMGRLICPSCSRLPTDEFLEAFHQWRAKVEQR